MGSILGGGRLALSNGTETQPVTVNPCFRLHEVYAQPDSRIPLSIISMLGLIPIS